MDLCQADHNQIPKKGMVCESSGQQRFNSILLEWGQLGEESTLGELQYKVNQQQARSRKSIKCSSSIVCKKERFHELFKQSKSGPRLTQQASVSEQAQALREQASIGRLRGNEITLVSRGCEEMMFEFMCHCVQGVRRAVLLLVPSLVSVRRVKFFTQYPILVQSLPHWIQNSYTSLTFVVDRRECASSAFARC